MRTQQLPGHRPSFHELLQVALIEDLSTASIVSALALGSVIQIEFEMHLAPQPDYNPGRLDASREDVLRLALEAAHMGLWYWDIRTGDIIWSPECLAIYGLPADTVMTYEKFLQAVHPDDRARVEQALQQSLSSDAPYELQKRIVLPDGAIHWTASRGRIFRDAAGEPMRMTGVTFDISEQKKAEEQRAAMQMRNEDLVKALGEIVYEWDPLANSLRWEGDFTRILGYSHADMGDDTQSWTGRVHADDWPSALAELKAAQQENRIYQCEYRFRHKNGGYVWMLDRGVLSVNSNGELLRVIGVFRDITERKKTEQRIGQLNRTYAVLSEINGLIARQQDQQLMLEDSCRIAVKTGGFIMAWVGLIMPGGKGMKVAAQAGATSDTIHILEGMFSGQQGRCRFTSDALHDATHAVCNDIENDPRAVDWREAAMARGYRSMVALPLVVEGRCVGTFNLYAGEPGFFDTEELRLLDELAIDVSFALEVRRRENERRATDERIARQRATLIALGAQQKADLPDAPGVLRQISEAAARTLGVDRVSIWRYNADRSAIECADLFELRREKHSAGFTLGSATHPAYFRALEESEVIAAHDAVNDPRTSEFSDDYLRPLGIGAMLDVPIRVEGARAGVLCHEHVGSPRRWTEDEQTFAVAVANLVSLTIETAQRREAEVAQRESDERFRSLIENASDLITVMSGDGVIRFQSPSSERMLGYAAHEMIGRNVFELIHADDAKQARDALQQALANSGAPVSVEFRFQHRNGAWRILQAVGRSMSSQADRDAVVVNSRDVTESRRLEEQFRQSQKMEAIGQLAGGVAHDFNNILAAMMMQAEMAGVCENLPEAREYLQDIRAAAERAANLTRQLLAFSRRQVMQPRQLDLNDIVTSLTKMLQRILGEDVRLQLTLCSRPLVIHADAGMLDQVLLNLVVNARDAMPSGGQLNIETSLITIEPEEASLLDASPGSHAVVTVTDTGAGIAPEHLSHIFEPFFTTKEPGKGTGLGLATVFGIVKQHGGAVRVASEVGRGTTFQILFPAEDASDVSPAVEEPKPKPRGGTETVLVVEDEPAVRTLTRTVLELHGYQVLEAVHGVEALRIWDQHTDRIHLLLTDIVMPEGIGGRELAARLRQRDPQLRVIFTSGYSADIAGRELTLEPGQNFIQKPSPPHELLATVRRSLDG